MKSPEMSMGVPKQETPETQVTPEDPEAEKELRRHVHNFFGHEWLLADGLEISNLSNQNKVYKLDSNIDSAGNINIGRLEEAGLYGRNNSVVVFVNEQGLAFIGPISEDRINALEAAGYMEGGRNVGVPLSNGEIIKNAAIQKYWKQLKEKENLKSDREITDMRLEEFAEAFKKNRESVRFLRRQKNFTKGHEH